MAVTRINNNQITTASAGNAYLGIDGSTKLQNYSVTAGKLANSLVYGSDLTVSGNLTVNGTSTAIDTTITTIEDPVIILASTQTGTPAVDIGFLGERGDETNIAFVWNEANSEFVTAFTGTSETNTTISISGYANARVGNMIVSGTTSLAGNVIGAANFTGNVTAGNLSTVGITSTGSLTASTTISATGNITGGNLSAGSGIIETTGNINGGNLNATSGVTSTTVSATGNIDAGNLITTGATSTGTLETTGNALIGGNLIVQGNISYINIDDLRVEDPIIVLGTGPNGAPLTVNDGKDRGIYMEYYTTGLGNAFVGWQNTSGNMIIANDVYFTANDVVGVNSYGTLEAGNLYVQSAVSTGDITGANLLTGGVVSATSNITGGNLLTGGVISATSNITGGNINTTGTLIGGNIVISGDDITDTNGRVNFNTAGADVDFAVNGDTVANAFYVDAGTGTASFGSATQTVNAIVAFNATSSILSPVGNTAQRPATGVTGMVRFNTTDNNLELYDNSAWTAVGVPVFTVIADEQFNGDGSTVAFTLGSTQTTNSCIVSINGVVQIPTIAYSVAGTDPTCVLTFTEAPETGDLIDVRQITTTTTVTSIANGPGNAVVSVSPTSALTTITGALSVTGGIIGALTNGTSNVAILNPNGNVSVAVGGVGIVSFSADGIVNNQANGVGNIGSSTTYFNTVFAQATSAQYADLAEKYVADAEYAPGTVVVFGGTHEVTVNATDADRKVAGVVSTNPSYIMNAGCEGEHVAAVALTGRVPTMVVGTVRKGDLMVSAGLGRARAEADPKVGTVIGKALEDFDGAEGTIEVVVGRF